MGKTPRLDRDPTQQPAGCQPASCHLTSQAVTGRILGSRKGSPLTPQRPEPRKRPQCAFF
eukprot:5031280-Alexandrium_andersonii.AAC.1